MELPPHNPQELKHLILHSNEPVLFKNKLDWKLLDWNLEEWGRKLKDEELSFRCGQNAFTKEPQWERTTTNRTATFNDFLSFTKTEREEWMYFDYKYLSQWFGSVSELKQDLKWDFFGFPNLTSKDCTMWIGSKGAHTPCHVDTYGCNLVAQIYGRKQWFLFPPEENLKPTRIPYEESSIYSRLNFFSPTVTDFKGVGNCRKIVMNPGDVLLVPHKWWHYVENLDTAISVNVWLPLPEDDEQRLEESLVQLFITQIADNLNEETKSIVLNPNSEEDIGKMTFNTSLSLINNCKNMCKKSNKKERFNAQKLDLSELFHKYAFLQKIPKLSVEELNVLLEAQKSRFENNQQEAGLNEELEELAGLVNAITHPDVVSLIKSKLLQ